MSASAPTAAGVSRSKGLALVAMLFAVAMTFIDQTIVAIATPGIAQELSLSRAGSQWVINAYLLALAAGFALGGRLADVVGAKTMVLIGIIGFAANVDAVRIDPQGCRRRGLARRLPCHPGLVGGAHGPGRACGRGGDASRSANAAGRWRSSSGSVAG